MYTASSSAANGGFASWPRRAESWLDSKGKYAWIIAMVAGFVIFWPIGLALLAYMIWSKRMFGQSCGPRRLGRDRDHERYAYNRNFGTSGNSAFDSYKAEMLNRLEEEQRAFESFLQRLRDSKDKAEFDSFMEDRARRAAETSSAPDAPTGPKPEEGRAGAY
jgi:hypothetical protein